MSATAVDPKIATARPELAGKYLTFTLGPEEYGVPVLKVREIIKVMDITQVPQVPPHVRGVINLRGKVIAVIDLRVRFGLEPREYDDRTCIIVVEGAEAGMVGIAVDAVCEVVTINGADVDATPDFGRQVTTDYLLGLAKVKGAVKILLDLDSVLGADVAAVAATF